MSKLLKLFLVFALVFTVVSTASAAEIYKYGSRGEMVTMIQTKLGVTPVTGYFGPITKAAVIAFQQANPPLKADGVVGPLTLEKLNATTTTTTPVAGCPAGAMYNSMTGALCSTTTLPAGCVAGAMYSSTTGQACTTTTTTTTTGLTGTDGAISDVTELSSYNNEEVGDGSENVKVLGMDVDTSKDGDVLVKSVKVSFDATGNTGSTRIADYLDTVKVLMGSTEVGSADTSDFTKDSTGHYSKIITLSNALLKADTTTKFYVVVDAVSNLDSGDISGDSWTVDVENMRYMDGSGVVTTTTDGNLDGMDVSISFVTFSSSADTKLKVSLDSTSPKSGIVEVDTDNNTEDVVLLKGKMKLEGTSDITLNELPIDFVATGATKVDYVTSSVKLTIDGEEYTESMGTTDATETVVFDNLDLALKAGDTVSFTVSADINDLDANFEVGDSVYAALSSTDRDDMDVENEQGDQLSDATEKSGTATGEAQYFYENYAKVELVGTPTNVVVTDHPEVSTVTFKVKVTAVGSDIYLNGAGETTAADEAFQLSTLGGGAGTSTLSAPSYTASGHTSNGNSVTNSGADNEYYTIAEDQSVTYTITATITQTVASTTVGAEIDTIQFGLVSTDQTTRSAYELSWANLMDQFETSQVTLVPAP